MSASAGHNLRIYATATDTAATSSDLIAGINDASYQRMRDILESTSFATAATDAWKRRLAGLKDGSFSLAGDFENADAPQALLRTVLESGADVYITVLVDGTNGFRVACLVESEDTSGTVDGKAETSFSLQFNGAPTAIP